MKEKKLIILNNNFNDTGSVFRRLEEIEITKEYSTEIKTEKVPKKRGRKPHERIYFSKDTENAIVLYNACNNERQRNKIYEDKIQFSFNKLAENMINTFKFDYITELYVDIKSDVVSHMLMNIHRYDPNLGKAFSYFSRMAKNFLIIKNNESYARFKDTKSIHEIELNDKDNEYDIEDSNYYKDIINSETNEFLELMVEYWDDNISSIFKKKRDIDIAYAVNELLRNSNKIEFYNKKALYLLMRELTGHKTQYITKVINKMMIYYCKIKNEYHTYGYIKSGQLFF